MSARLKGVVISPVPNKRTANAYSNDLQHTVERFRIAESGFKKGREVHKLRRSTAPSRLSHCDGRSLLPWNKSYRDEVVAFCPLPVQIGHNGLPLLTPMLARRKPFKTHHIDALLRITATYLG
jgi:hypothetical protein